MTSHPKIHPTHLARHAYVYVRQSTLRQVLYATESKERQYGLGERACALGWPATQVVVIDEDQGQSGSRAHDRTGFQDLMGAIALDQVGIVLVLEVARLARNCGDWYRVLEVAALAGTLIGDIDGVYDPRDYNDRLLLGLKGTLSEAELYALKTRLHGGRLNKARKGTLVQMLPVGLVRARDGRVTVDPHLDVQTTVRTVFAQFERLGSANAVLRYFRTHDVLMPRLITDGEDPSALVWQPASYSSLYLMLTNPAYAGAFAFGRRHPAAGRVPGELTPRTRMPREEWQVLVQDVYPAYITWERYVRNRERLRQNQGQFARHPGVPRQGMALLPGIVFCAHCGRRLMVRYGESAAYVCEHLRKRYAAPRCQTFTITHVDQAVVAAFLEVIEPARVEAPLATLTQLEHQRQELEQLWHHRLERARYEVERARRQYDRVEPENRLVARELEKQWNAALHTLTTLEEKYAQERAHALAPLSTADRALIERVVTDLPGLWQAPTTTSTDRKHLLRCLIRDVSLDSFSAPGQTRLHIRWQTGCVTTVTVRRPTCGDVHRLDSVVVARIRELAQTDADDQIAALLNAQGFTTQQGLPWTYRRVLDTRRRHHIPTACPITPRGHEPRGDGLVSVHAAARQFETCRSTILNWACRGLLYSEHKAGICPLWIRVLPEDVARLTQRTVPAQSVGIRQACQALHITEAELWAAVKAGHYTGYRVRRHQHWEFRITIP
jgi:DNA invertase Pin-like site-specific DNA recombinase